VIEENLRPSSAEAGALFWQVEGSLLRLSSARSVGFFTWNAQSFSGRWARREGLALLALITPFVYVAHRVLAVRLLHAVLRGISRDRLDLLGEEYFEYILKPRLNPRAVQALQEILARGEPVILVSHGLDHIVRPLAQFLGVPYVLANRLEFRDGYATGRLLEPVIPPPGIRARLNFPGSRNGDGRINAATLAKRLGLSAGPAALAGALVPARRISAFPRHPLVLFEPERRTAPLSVRKALAGRNVLLIGATGFIGKVWLVTALTELPDLGRIFLLIRRQRSTTALRRLEKVVAESPLFEHLHERYGEKLASFLRERLEVLEGDVSQPGLGLAPETRARLARSLDLIIHSGGLTDFNPDLRTALAANVDATLYLIEFLRQCERTALLHLSTCFVVGRRDGRVSEELIPNYTPTGFPNFDAEAERQSLHALARAIEERAESPEVTAALKRQSLAKGSADPGMTEAALEHQIRKNRFRWVRSQMVEAGMRRARELGWPNTYTFTKSLAESLLVRHAADLPVAVVRPAIVETSTEQPFRGWNEGVNTSAPLSYLLGTWFRQLPTNERKCLDLIPVDLVTRGMMLIAAALVERRHARLYQLATSACNPCDMRRSIELTALAHRKYYRAQKGFEPRLLARFDPIPVSKGRYRLFSAPGQKAMVRMLRRVMPPVPFARSPLLRKERDLERLEKLIELYEPFILHNEHVFEAQNIEVLAAALAEEERGVFGYDPHAIDWWDYWINIHVPALRRWTYPLIEGRAVESHPPRTFRLEMGSPGESAGDAAANA
jgi:hypothetical protein